MARISYKRHRFPPTVIQCAVWLYFRFTLSLRDVEEMMAHRGVDVSYETIRAWTVKFGLSTAERKCIARADHQHASRIDARSHGRRGAGCLG